MIRDGAIRHKKIDTIVIGPSVTNVPSPQITVAILRAWSIFLSENASNKFTRLPNVMTSGSPTIAAAVTSRTVGFFFQTKFVSILTSKFPGCP